jgi:trimethylamine:corrinoid methyltransferase-like protein
MARLSEAIGCRGCPVPVVAGSVAPHLHTLEAERIALLYTQYHGGELTATSPAQISILKEMNAAAGRRYRLALEGLISPLKLNPEVFDVFFEYAEDPDVEIVIFSAIPMAGGTAPLSLPAGLVQVLAEAIAHDFVYATLSQGTVKSFSIRLDPFDMRHTNIVFGSPEWCLFQQLTTELSKGLFGTDAVSGKFRTNSRIVDPQSMLERTATALWQAAMGIRRFAGVGQICVDEVFSPVQAMLDLEILGYVARLSRGLSDAWREDVDAVQEIREGIEAGTFMANQTTLEIFRGVYEFDRLSTAMNLNSWLSGGSPRIEAMAWERAQRKIADFSYELPASRRRDVEDVYRRGTTL